MPAHLVDSHGTVEPSVDPEGLARRVDEGVFFWLDLEHPTDDELELLHRELGVHPLALEDAKKFGQRPKIDEYDDFVALVVFGAEDDLESEAGLRPVEVHCFYSQHWLVTVHRGQAEVFRELREKHAQKLRRLDEGLGILYFVLDALVDSFFPQLSELDDEIDRLQDEILVDAQPAHLQEAIAMKRSLVQLRKLVHPQRDLFSALLSRRFELPGMDERHEHYFRDVYDHLIRLSEQIDDYRDLAAGTGDLYQSTIGNKMNLTMKQLGWVATFFLPLSFLTGFFGQNFNLLVNHLITPDWVFWVFGLCLDAVAFGVVFSWYVNRERGNLLLRHPQLPALPRRRRRRNA